MISRRAFLTTAIAAAAVPVTMLPALPTGTLLRKPPGRELRATVALDPAQAASYTVFMDRRWDPVRERMICRFVELSPTAFQRLTPAERRFTLISHPGHGPPLFPLRPLGSRGPGEPC